MNNLLSQIGGPTIVIFIGGVIAAFGGFVAASGAVWSSYQQNILNDRLDKKNEEIIKLNRDINAAVTGGNSFCYLIPTESATPHAMLIHSGEHPLYDVEFTILDLDVMDSAMANAKLKNTEDVLRMYKRVAPGNLAAHSSILLGRDLLPTDSDYKRFTIQLSARNGFCSESLRMRRSDDGVWSYAIKVQRDHDDGTSEIVYSHISDRYPKQPDGSIDWH